MHDDEPTPKRRRTARSKHTTMQARIKLSESLTDVDWRLLHWLLRYPLQRVDDLVVGVARWASRATVYRHLRELEVRGLVESMLPKTPGAGKRLYHLSNAGLHILAGYLQRSARELARGFQADEAGVLRVLPRLPTLLPLQDVVNGLITYAAEAVTTQGRRPRLVRWDWQRDVVHRFHYRERVLYFTADGAVALTMRMQQGDGGSVQDLWYGLFLLSSELDDERPMRLRLEHLLCWRESPERWSFYQHMPPVLILARSPRQREHWQHAVEAAALKLRLEPLVGAVACFSSAESAHVNPWSLNWRTLSTGLPCHLRDLLRPLPRAALPPSLRLEEDGGVVGESDARREPSSSTIIAGVSGAPPARLGRLMVGDLTQRVACIGRDELEEQEVIALLGLRLTPCQWSMLHLLLAHPLLSAEELATYLSLRRPSARRSLYELHGLGCLEPIATTGGGKRWHLCGRGLHLLASASRIHIRNIATWPENTEVPKTANVVQRGEAGIVQHIQHTAGIYGFFTRLTQAAQREMGQTLCWWETGPACERRYRVHEQWYNLRPDAQAAYRVGQQQMRFWLEWDRGTMNVRDLSIKFTSYAHYVATREWARESARVPTLLCIAPDIAQERRIHRVAQARLTPPSGLAMWTTIEVLLNERGPLAPIWLPGISQGSQVAQLSGSLRQAWSEVVSGKKGT
ncbi:MAG: hypothetical protein NVS2B12_32090 [Ktedonobacteraceae bacterium]